MYTSTVYPRHIHEIHEHMLRKCYDLFVAPSWIIFFPLVFVLREEGDKIIAEAAVS